MPTVPTWAKATPRSRPGVASGPAGSSGSAWTTRPRPARRPPPGADYLGVTVWGTPTKPEAVAGGPSVVTTVAEASGLPVVGIGGIDAGNAAEVMAAGAAGVAVISAVAAAEDPVAATRELRAAIVEWRRWSGATT